MAAILLVDDDDVARHIVRRMLERAGHHVEEAGDGEAAITALEGGLKPDCMVLDLMMPRLSGVDVLRRIRNETRCQRSPPGEAPASGGWTCPAAPARTPAGRTCRSS